MSNNYLSRLYCISSFLTQKVIPYQKFQQNATSLTFLPAQNTTMKISYFERMSWTMKWIDVFFSFGTSYLKLLLIFEALHMLPSRTYWNFLFSIVSYPWNSSCTTFKNILEVFIYLLLLFSGITFENILKLLVYYYD